MSPAVSRDKKEQGQTDKRRQQEGKEERNNGLRGKNKTRTSRQNFRTKQCYSLTMFPVSISTDLYHSQNRPGEAQRSAKKT